VHIRPAEADGPDITNSITLTPDVGGHGSLSGLSADAGPPNVFVCMALRLTASFN
jgi:hypothetical protein